MRLAAIPYRPDSTELFDVLADEPWAVFLDSGHPGATGGRWDIIAARPYATLVTRGEITEFRQGGSVARGVDDPFERLRSHLAASRHDLPLPFVGGGIGYFAYDLARRFVRLPELAEDGEGMPEMAVGFYDWAVLVDHARRESWLVSAGRCPLSAAGWKGLVELFSTPPDPRRRAPFVVVGPLVCNLSEAAYRSRFDRIQAYIRAGDCYQVNLAQRFSCSVSGDPWLAYRALRRVNPAPYSIYMSLPWAKVLSASPERFLEVRGGQVVTRPIKGTRPRHPEPDRDAARARELATSTKDRAENLMIVDLLRNDLGKVCMPGSVQVPGLFEVEHFATVHHLVSTVSGRLAPGQDAVTLLRAAFPGGSITGAPKLRAMQIIEELEPHRRGIYCGAIGYLGYNGDMDTNIAIRTLVWSEGTLRFWAGGGIVADSDAASEYQECLDKAAAVIGLLDAHRA
ncbi:MAG: aminodeoxychorismate synthase component I [Thiobacillaceae bacterium]